MIFTFYRGKSPLNHHLGSIFYCCPTSSCNSKQPFCPQSHQLQGICWHIAPLEGRGMAEDVRTWAENGTWVIEILEMLILKMWLIEWIVQMLMICDICMMFNEGTNDSDIEINLIHWILIEIDEWFSSIFVILPCWELTYPLPRPFLKMIFLSSGGIWYFRGGYVEIGND